MEAIRLAPSTPLTQWGRAGPQGPCRAAKRTDSLVSLGTLSVRCPSCGTWVTCFPCLGSHKGYRSPSRAQDIRLVLQAGSSPVCFGIVRGALHLQQGSPRCSSPTAKGSPKCLNLIWEAVGGCRCVKDRAGGSNWRELVRGLSHRAQQCPHAEPGQ